MFLIVGLGNPGTKYTYTRHNIGFLVIDRLVSRLNIEGAFKKHQAIVFEGMVNKKKILLAKPQTFMNLSGNAVMLLKQFYKLASHQVLIITDDYYQPFGFLRIRFKGSSGGHNGLESIINYLSEDFVRIRCGIGNYQDKTPMASFVLNNFTSKEKKDLNDYLKVIVDCLICCLQEDFKKASSTFSNKYFMDLASLS